MSSFLGSKPFLDKILSQLSSENISSLLSLINNPGTPTTVYLYGEQNVLSSANIGVNYVQLMVDKLNKRYLYGFLVYIDNNNCGFFSFSGKQSPMIEIEINPVTLEYRDVYENLSAEEFRRTLADLAIEAGSVEGYVTEEELQAALVADKDILSKITKEYDEDYDATYIRFPVGIMPLSITINNHQLYFKHNKAVNNRGQSVEGYEVDEMVFDGPDYYISFNGDISDQVINALTYVNYNGSVGGSILTTNSYYLFFPQGGTKLYKHKVPGYKSVTLINNSATPLVITTPLDLMNAIKSSIIGFIGNDIDGSLITGVETVGEADTDIDVYEIYQTSISANNFYGPAFPFGTDQITEL